MEKKLPLLHGHYYHLFNRGNNGSDIFLDTENYYYFLRLYAKYVSPVADTFAYCLLKKHFHLLVRIKKREEILEKDLSYTTTQKAKVIEPYLQFSHFFNAYTQGMNKRYGRTGSVFETKYERKLIETKSLFRQLVFCIHYQPVQRGLTSDFKIYPWSSYGSLLSEQTTMLGRAFVLDLFKGEGNFVAYHKINPCEETIKQVLIGFD